MKIPKLYIISWKDASEYRDQTWADREELNDFIDTDVICLSVGYWVEEKDGYMTLAGDYDEGNFGRIMKIPLINIVKRRLVK